MTTRAMSANTERFTATAMCPKCGAVDIHWLDTPRIKPPGWDQTPTGKALTRINESIRLMSTYTPTSPFEPEDSVVARVCRNCEYRWGQA